MIDHLYGNGLAISAVPFQDCTRDNVAMFIVRLWKHTRHGYTVPLLQ